MNCCPNGFGGMASRPTPPGISSSVRQRSLRASPGMLMSARVRVLTLLVMARYSARVPSALPRAEEVGHDPHRVPCGHEDGGTCVLTPHHRSRLQAVAEL